MSKGKTTHSLKVCNHTEGYANPQKFTKTYFRVNEIFIMLDTSQI